MKLKKTNVLLSCLVAASVVSVGFNVNNSIATREDLATLNKMIVEKDNNIEELKEENKALQEQLTEVNKDLKEVKSEIKEIKN